MNSRYKILHFEADPSDADLIHTELRKILRNCEVTWVSDIDMYSETLQKETFQLIVSDYEAHKNIEMDCLNLAKKHQFECPFIYVADAPGDAAVLETLKDGADDYVLKKGLEKLSQSVIRITQKSTVIPSTDEPLKNMHNFNPHVLDALMNKIIVINNEGVIMYSNKAWQESILELGGGKYKHLVTGSNYLENLDHMKESQATIKYISERICAVISGNEEYFSYDYILTGHEHTEWFNMQVTPCVDFHGAVISHTNITNRMLSESSYKINGDEFVSLPEHTPNCILQVSPSLIIVDANQDVFSLTKKELIGASILSIFDPKNRDQIKANLQEVLTTKKSKYALATREIDGSTIRTEISVECVQNDSGNIDFLIVVLRDFRDFFEHYLKLERKNRELQLLHQINQIGLNKDQNMDDLTCKSLELIPQLLPSEHQQFYTFHSNEQGLELSQEYPPLPINNNSSVERGVFGSVKQLIPWIPNHSELFTSIIEDRTIVTYDSKEISECLNHSIQTFEAGSQVKKVNAINHIKTLIVVPIQTNQMTLGAYVITSSVVVNLAEIAALERYLIGVKAVIVQKFVEQDLYNKELKYRTLFEENVAGVYLTDLNDRFVSCNRAYAEILGLSSPEDVIGKHQEELYEILETEVIESSQQGNCRARESHIVTKDGNEIYLLENYSTVTSQSGLPLYLQGTVFHITKQKLSEIQIHESEYKYKSLFENLAEGIIYTDTNGYILSVNPGLCRILGYSEDQMIGKLSYDFLVNPEKGRRLLNELDSDLEGAHGFYELKFVSQSGGIVLTQLASTPSYDRDKKLVGVMSIIIDITERKLVEKEKLRMKQQFTRELEYKVAERTEALESARWELAKSLEKEKELSQLKSRFVSTASHQFRTPLSVIQSSMGVLAMQTERMSEEFRPQFDKIYDRIKDQIERMTDLMNDVLIIGKINAGNVAVRMESSDATEICRNVIASYHQILHARQLTLVVNGIVRDIVVDSKLLEHALSNFISNALKYSPDDSECAVLVEFDDTTVSIAIRDEGIGIPKSELAHLFEPFYRAANATKFLGTGLGTTIAKEYIEMIGGTVEVKSALGEGSEFIIKFNQ